MLDYLRRYFPNTTNDELAGCIGVSKTTLIRKARELGLEKDPKWLSSIQRVNIRLANSVNKRKGNPGRFKKGEHAYPDGEFKPGVSQSEEIKRKQIAGIKKWYRLHPLEAKAKSYKAWETRRLQQKNDVQSA